jgi:hypothetical protein
VSNAALFCRQRPYSFDIADGRIREIYVVRIPDKLRGFLEHTR